MDKIRDVAVIVGSLCIILKLRIPSARRRLLSVSFGWPIYFVDGVLVSTGEITPECDLLLECLTVLANLFLRPRHVSSQSDFRSRQTIP